MADQFPQKFGKYKIVKEVGRGGFADVYKAVDIPLNRAVALKFLEPRLLREPTFVERFQREAQLAANLKHPNIVIIHEFGWEAGAAYLAMEFLEGRTLKEVVLEERALPPRRIVNIVGQIASALDYAHGRGLVHRDIKPSNVMVGADDHVTVMDFGIAKAATHTALTTTGKIFGTPEYMSPEQAEGVEEPDTRSDIYSLGVVVYEMITGQVPFSGTTPLSIIRGHADKPPPRPSKVNPAVSPAVEAVLLKALAKKREARYQSVGEMAAALQQAVSEAVVEEVKVPSPARPALPWKWVAGMGVVVVVVVGLIIALVSGGGPATKPTPTSEAAALAPTATTTVPTNTPTSVPPTSTPLSPTPTDTPTVPPTDTPTPKPVAVVQAEVLNVRGGPGTEYDVLGQVEQGDQLEIVTRTEGGDWLQVRLTDGKEGWVSVQLVEVGGGVTGIPVAAVIPLTPTPSAPLDMVHVPAGEFIMGSDEGDRNEQPVHTVYLDAFYIDKYEVTNAQFAQFLNEQGNQEEGGVTWLDIGDEDCRITQSGGQYQPKSGYSDHPIIEVSWYGTKAYCQWVGKRLPTEAEWEKAARGTDERTYPWVGGIDCDHAQYWGCGGRTVPVGSKPKGVSPYGALDMVGNVWEWVADWYDSGYYAASPENNPKGPASGDYRVIRGGSWLDLEVNVRAALRRGDSPDSTLSSVGFRCAR
jgi:formylglycine-generating enzyme required for sulfatase activity/serine/threonine protein kinase